MISLAEDISLITGFQKLLMSYNHSGDIGALSLAKSLKHFNNLSDLDLSYNRIGDEGAIAITRAVSHIEGLRFRIWSHRISEKGSSEIASLVGNIDRDFHQALTISSEMPGKN